MPRDGRMVAYVSMFVYPAAPAANSAARASACDGVFSDIKRDIVGHEPTSRLVREDRLAAPSSGHAARGLHVVYTGSRQRFDGQDQAVREEASLFCHASERWLVLYRVTMPEGVDATPEVDRLMHALTWPASLRDDTDQVSSIEHKRGPSPGTDRARVTTKPSSP